MSTYTTEDKVAFIKSLYCPARAVARATGSSWEIILAQAAAETGWGKKVLPGTNNIFNIKADPSWTGEKKTFRVWERQNGKTIWVNDDFRVYPDINAALNDRIAFLASNPRYRRAGLFDEGVKGLLEKEAQALQTAGYATDENYAANLVSVFRGSTMQRAIREAEAQGCCETKADWAFPFQELDGNEILDGGVYIGSPSLSVGALPKAQDGFYPIGASGIWHGGIHFDAGTGTKLDQRGGVRCIKDGEVVAYLVNSAYQVIEFPADGVQALYSTGFTLIRHRLECPSPPSPPAATASSKLAPAMTPPTTAPATAASKPGPQLPNPAAPPAPAATTTSPPTTPRAKPASPAIAAATASTASPDQKAAPDASAKRSMLTFYSLYMHQLDYQSYQEEPERKRPGYWSESKEYVVGAKARDLQQDGPDLPEAPQEPEMFGQWDDFACWPEVDWCEARATGDDAKVFGLNIRKEASGRSTKLGLLPRGARVELGERSKNGKWARIAQFIAGETAPVQRGGVVDPAAATGWVFVGELDPGPAQPRAFDEVVFLDPAAPIAAGDLVGYLGEYQQYVDAKADPTRGQRRLLHLEVFTGDDLPAFIEQCRTYAKTLPVESRSLFVIEHGAQLVQPAPCDGEIGAAEHVLPDGEASGAWVRVQHGNLSITDREKLGRYNGSTRTYACGAIFTAWYVGAKDDQRTQDRATSERLGYTRREVMTPSGPPVWVERTALEARAEAPASGAALKSWSVFPLRLSAAGGTPVGLTRVLSRMELARSPASGQAVDPEGRRWWKVSVRRAANDRDGKNALVGWACEKGHEKVSWQSPWAWPGFAYVEEGEIQPVDMWSATLLRAGMANEEELVDFTARADKVDRSALLKKLYELIDTNANGIFEPHELRTATAQPLLAQALSRLIARYESEWGGADAKWDELDQLVLDGKAEWQAEKLRIKRMRWWPLVADGVKGFPCDPIAYHIHPIALIENFHPRTSARKSVGGPLEKSGAHWVDRFPQSKNISDLKQPFQGYVTQFFAALSAAGVTYDINTTLRPPQRSYLMYYARKITEGLSPDNVPPFVPENDDEPVNIDWAHRDSVGRPDLVAAKAAAKAMDKSFNASQAIGAPYKSNHNGGQAIDVRFSPAWGIGKSVIDATGKTVKIESKRDLLNVGATYKVYHWTYHGPKAKSDEPHWSATGN